MEHQRISLRRGQQWCMHAAAGTVFVVLRGEIEWRQLVFIEMACPVRIRLSEGAGHTAQDSGWVFVHASGEAEFGWSAPPRRGLRARALNLSRWFSGLRLFGRSGLFGKSGQ